MVGQFYAVLLLLGTAFLYASGLNEEAEEQSVVLQLPAPQSATDDDLNATNGSLAKGGPAAAAGANLTSTTPPPALGPLERLGQFAKSLSPFPLNHSAPAPPTGPVSNASNTSPGTNATEGFTPYNATMVPLEQPPTASTNAPPLVPVGLPVDDEAVALVSLNLSNTTTSTTTPKPAPPPPQPASASSTGWSMLAAFGGVAMLLLGGSLMI